MCDMRDQENRYAERKKRELAEEQDKGLSKEYLKRLVRSDARTYYGTPSLNDHLFLHYKGLNVIRALEEFTALKVLYMEGNGVSLI